MRLPATVKRYGVVNAVNVATCAHRRVFVRARGQDQVSVSIGMIRMLRCNETTDHRRNQVHCRAIHEVACSRPQRLLQCNSNVAWRTIPTSHNRN